MRVTHYVFLKLCFRFIIIDHSLFSPKFKKQQERERERERERESLKVKVQSFNIAALIRYKYYDTA